ncbi:ABC transporter permease [Advenella mimigardefordensis]|uniref:Putative ABC transporter permease protein n=1 Tax=Advenella mimigardefordensis (strain DSM 17166 / LMG 22922 / DPN7) TaxID=1247726 RepID=W0PLZ3_ADVMD|nr:ABC transporter permease [Advenella mimigardefordensis]AHG66028.1 putative ABC transporter permease protein [Advenella mimigardefordensis DPN7]
MTSRLSPFQDRQLSFLLAINIVIVMAGYFLSSGGDFVSVFNLQSMAMQLPQMALLAMAMMLSMISGNGGIDLSGIALANLAGVIGALLLPQWIDAEAAPWLFTAAFVGLMLSVGLLGGMLNGIIIARFNLTPILTTLGTQLVFTGIATVLSNGSSVNLPYIEPLSAIGNDNFLGVPIAFYLFVAVVLFLGWLLRRTPFGLRLYMQGTNPKAAFYAGISRNTMLICTYTMCGLLAACSGLISASQAASASAKYGDSYLLIAILIAVMGGVNPAGGYGRVICVFFAATALQLLSSMFNLLGLSEFAGNCIWGLLLLFFLAYSRQELKLKIKRREPVKA